jgi:hypothetical protein
MGTRRGRRGLVFVPGPSVSSLRPLGSETCVLIAHIPWGRSVGGTDCPDCFGACRRGRFDIAAGGLGNRAPARRATPPGVPQSDPCRAEGTTRRRAAAKPHLTLLVVSSSA